MIKLKNILRESGLLSEQQAQPIVITVTKDMTPEQLTQRFGDVAPGTKITLNFNLESDILANEAPTQDLIKTVAEKLRMIDSFIDNGTIRVIAHASKAPATMKKFGQPGKAEQPAVLGALTKTTSLGGLSISPLTADQFKDNGNSTSATRGKGNTNLAINRAALLGTAITKSGVSLQKYKIVYDVEINKDEPWVGIEITGNLKDIPSPKMNLHRIALGFSDSNIGFFCMENLKNYESIPVNEILGNVDKNIKKLSTSKNSDELKYLDSYQWMKGNLTGRMRDSYSTAIYGAVIYPENPRSKPLVDLLKKYGATQSEVNPETQIRLENTTAEYIWFIYDERQIVNFFQQVSQDELKQITEQTRKK